MCKSPQQKASPRVTDKPWTIFRHKPLKHRAWREWHQELLVSWLFQTCIRLQTSWDRHFAQLGLSWQEANIMLTCVKSREITSGRLAIMVARDKGKITAYIDRLEAKHLVRRYIGSQDQRVSIIRPTANGKRIAAMAESIFQRLRGELFAGIIDSDIHRLSRVLPRMHQNV